jgi:hypothetical protein
LLSENRNANSEGGDSGEAGIVLGSLDLNLEGKIEACYWGSGRETKQRNQDTFEEAK